jgi:purine nucleosidase
MIPVILDCDPGGDDAVAILMALSAPKEIDLKAITTISGNASLEWIHTNARKICELAGRTGIPVYAGCSNALLRPAVNASFCHGNDGLAGATLPSPTMPLQKEHAVDFLVEALLNAQAPITLAMTAPLTNLAVALMKNPDIVKGIKEIVWMGGSMDTGNITPAAEFNAYVDPHALQIVLSRNIPFRLIGLHITHQVTTSEPWMERLRAQGSEVSKQVAGILAVEALSDQGRYGIPGRAIHDACVIASLLKPELFTWKNAAISVETTEGPHVGATIISTYPAHIKENNHTSCAISVDGTAAMEFILECLGTYAVPQKVASGF